MQKLEFKANPEQGGRLRERIDNMISDQPLRLFTAHLFLYTHARPHTDSSQSRPTVLARRTLLVYSNPHSLKYVNEIASRIKNSEVKDYVDESLDNSAILDPFSHPG